MIVQTDNRMARAVNFPSVAKDSIALVTDVSAPGSSYQNTSYGLAGLGDITGFVNSLGSGDIGGAFTNLFTGTSPVSLVAYAGGALVLYKLFSGSKRKERSNKLKQAKADYRAQTSKIKDQYAIF